MDLSTGSPMHTLIVAAGVVILMPIGLWLIRRFGYGTIMIAIGLMFLAAILFAK